MVVLIDKLCEKMTSVKTTSKAGAALFATKDYKAGDIILEETPLLTLQKKSASDIIAIREQFQNIKAEKKVTNLVTNCEAGGKLQVLCLIRRRTGRP